MTVPGATASIRMPADDQDAARLRAKLATAAFAAAYTGWPGRAATAAFDVTRMQVRVLGWPRGYAAWRTLIAGRMLSKMRLQASASLESSTRKPDTRPAVRMRTSGQP